MAVTPYKPLVTALWVIALVVTVPIFVFNAPGVWWIMAAVAFAVAWGVSFWASRQLDPAVRRERQQRLLHSWHYWVAMVVLAFGTSIVGNALDAWYYRLVGWVVVGAVAYVVMRPAFHS